MHYDHAGNIAAFPKARLHLQEKWRIARVAACATRRCAALRGSGRGPGRRAAACRPAGVPRRRCRDRARRQPAPDRRAHGRPAGGARRDREAGWCWPAMPRITGTTCAPAGRFPSCSTWAGCWTAIAASRNWRTGRSTSFRHDPAVLARFPPVRGADGIVALHRHPLDTYAERKSPRAAAGLSRFRWRMDLGANSDESNSRGDRGHGSQGPDGAGAHPGTCAFTAGSKPPGHRGVRTGRLRSGVHPPASPTICSSIPWLRR